MPPASSPREPLSGPSALHSRRSFLTDALRALSSTLATSAVVPAIVAPALPVAATLAIPLVFPNANGPAGSALAEDRQPSAGKDVPQKIRFRKSPRADDRLQAVLKIETTGELKLNADGRKVSRSPVEAAAELAFDECLTADGLALRHYTKAEATLKVGNKTFPSRLRDNRRYVAARLEPLPEPASPASPTSPPSSASPSSPASPTVPDAGPKADRAPSKAPDSGSKSTVPTQEVSTAASRSLRGPGTCLLYSPQGPLHRDELELLQVPGNGPPLTELLGDGELAPGDSWPVPPETLAQLLWLEAVSSSAVTAVLKSIEGSVALISLEGSVAGAVGGVATDIDLTGKLNYDTQQQLVVWCALSIKENRSIGHAEPGFETTTQLRMATRRGEPAKTLVPTAYSGLPLTYERGQSLLEYVSAEGRFQMLLDRRWRLMVDRHDLTVLRLVDRGDLVAQCNASRLPALAPGKELPLDELQEDIRQSLGKNLRQFIEASVSRTDEGLRILRVAAAGEAAEIPVQWNYYHISNAKGQRLALVFTLETEQLDRFAEIDRPLAASLTFLDDPEPTAAKRKVAPASSLPAAGTGARADGKSDSSTAVPSKADLGRAGLSALNSQVPRVSSSRAKPSRTVQPASVSESVRASDRSPQGDAPRRR
ncbi:MAG: hypothetical protein RLY70_2082 [Planctomycetota bacterium]|jgi:hypothetical protein